MLHRKIYRSSDTQERTLIYEDNANADGKIISYIDHKSIDKVGGICEYNNDGLLLTEIETTDGKECIRTEFSYDDEGNFINKKLMIAGEVFEEESRVYSDKEITSTTTQYGEVILKSKESTDNTSSIKEFYNNHKLTEKHTSHFDNTTLIKTTTIRDSKNNVRAIRTEQFDAKKNLLNYEEKNENGNIVTLSEYIYNHNLLILEKHQNHNSNDYSETSYEYDARHNLTYKENRKRPNDIEESLKFEYNDQNRVIKEIKYTSGNFNAMAGRNDPGKTQVFEYEYFED